jgi:hypothetical protein
MPLNFGLVVVCLLGSTDSGDTDISRSHVSFVFERINISSSNHQTRRRKVKMVENCLPNFLIPQFCLLANTPNFAPRTTVRPKMCFSSKVSVEAFTFDYVAHHNKSFETKRLFFEASLDFEVVSTL